MQSIEQKPGIAFFALKKTLTWKICAIFMYQFICIWWILFFFNSYQTTVLIFWNWFVISGFKIYIGDYLLFDILVNGKIDNVSRLIHFLKEKKIVSVFEKKCQFIVSFKVLPCYRQKVRKTRQFCWKFTSCIFVVWLTQKT